MDYIGDDHENVFLGTAEDDTIHGGGGNDYLGGGNGNDFLYGGNGRDYLFGGQGQDIFHLSLSDSFSGSDFIGDFNSSEDKISINLQDFGLSSAQDFILETRGDTQAQSNSSAFIFDTNTHSLWFDADGAGGADPIRLAEFFNGANVEVNDFVFI